MHLINQALGIDPNALGEQTVEALQALIARAEAPQMLRKEIAGLRYIRARAIINRLQVEIDLNQELALQRGLIEDFGGTIDLMTATKGPVADAFRALPRDLIRSWR